MTQHVSSDPVERTLHRAFDPLPKRSLGLATGAVAALLVFSITVFHVIWPSTPINLQLLAQYFYGYEVTWLGAVIGAWWSFVAGFVAGWFVAFVRNFTMATWLFLVRAKADLTQTTDFLITFDASVMTDQLTPQEERAIRHAVASASEQGWGIAIGLLFGLGLLLATLVLVAKGGPTPGAHLGRLGMVFPGYRVTWGGGAIGFVYGFVLGYAIGRTVAASYNRFSAS